MSAARCISTTAASGGVKRMHELYAVNDHVGFMLGERVGIKLMVLDAIKGLKVA